MTCNKICLGQIGKHGKEGGMSGENNETFPIRNVTMLLSGNLEARPVLRLLGEITKGGSPHGRRLEPQVPVLGKVR